MEACTRGKSGPRWGSRRIARSRARCADTAVPNVRTCCLWAVVVATALGPASSAAVVLTKIQVVTKATDCGYPTTAVSSDGRTVDVSRNRRDVANEVAIVRYK